MPPGNRLFTVGRQNKAPSANMARVFALFRPASQRDIVCMVLSAITQLSDGIDPATRYSGGGLPKGGVMIVVLAALYILPSLLAWQRQSSRIKKIVLINLLLGWTVIGWIVAMVLTFAWEPPRDGEVDVPHQR